MEATYGAETLTAGLLAMTNSAGTWERVGDEAALIAACQRGEREAFDQLVEHHQRIVYRLCYRYVNNHEDASDLAQEVFIKAYRGIRRFRGDSSIATWLYRIAVNTCLSFRAARRPQSEEYNDDAQATAADLHERLERDERSRRVREAVMRLPEKQRATLILKIYHDLKHEEVARLMGTTVGTAKANLFHALTNLKRLLETQPGGTP